MNSKENYFSGFFQQNHIFFSAYRKTIERAKLTQQKNHDRHRFAKPRQNFLLVTLPVD